MNRLDGKIAIVTGGSKGLGEADARLFVAEGATVIITDIDDAAGEKIAAELGPKAEYHHHDVRDEQRWIELIADVVKRHGDLHILVNNAGVVIPVSYTHLRAHETSLHLVCRLLLEKNYQTLVVLL